MPLIKSVKILKDFRISISFTSFKDQSAIDSSIKSPEKASPEFYKSLRDLEGTVKEICELPSNSRVDILGVNFTYIGEDKIMGAKVIFKLRLLSDEFVEITTPYRYASSVTESTPDSQLMNNELEEKFVKISEEATLYINGKREQVDLLEEKA